MLCCLLKLKGNSGFQGFFPCPFLKAVTKEGNVRAKENIKHYQSCESYRGK